MDKQTDLKLIIGNKNYSSWSLRPWFFLKNLEVGFEEQLVYLFKDETKEFLASYFSNDKVPLLIDSSNPEKPLEVWDSLAIIEYIADKFPQKKGLPTELAARAVARSASAEMHSSFMALRDALPMNCRKFYSDYEITNDVQQDINRVVDIWDNCHISYGEGGDWLFGEFSGADAMFAPIVSRFETYDIKLNGFAAEYAQMVGENVYMKEWVEAGKKETEVIDLDEV